MGETRNKNYDAAIRKRPWSNLNHDVLYSVMMRLGVVEFLSFSKVCKSWRSLALSNKKTFMTSKPPMAMFISSKNTCYLQDFEGKQFKTIIPQSADRSCFGVTCGYLILFGEKTRDFWLVNPITGHELHFPDVPDDVGLLEEYGFVNMRAILVFSPLINGWVFVMLNFCEYQIWFSIAGKGKWSHFSSTFCFLDVHSFEGKIYILSRDYSWSGRRVYELRLEPVPKLMLLDTRVLNYSLYGLKFISTDENLYLMDYWPDNLHTLYKLDFDQRTWVPCEKTMEEYALFYSFVNHGAALKPESWAAPSSQYARFFGHDRPGKGRFLTSKFWYFPHDCLNGTLSHG